MSKSEHLKEVARLMRVLAKEQAASEKAMKARQALPPGSSRARVTTANARWWSAAEARDQTVEMLKKLGVSIKYPEGVS